MDAILITMRGMLSVVVMAMLVVLLAMAVDLASGLQKARVRGDLRTSTGLKRTLTKFITYEGGMLIAAGVDLLIHLSHLYDILKLEVVQGVPIVTCLVGIFLLVVEWMSVREKADEKTKTNFSRTEELAIKAMSKDEVMQTLLEILKEARGGKKDN